jgi:glycosyltransferase involved in cell wall biosynthesis
MSETVISVCLITYNHVNYIKQAIECVLSQKTNFAWEFIIADDCSSDGTFDVLAIYQSRYPKLIHIIKQQVNIGPRKNFIELLRNAKGKYVAYFEGDDYWIDEYKLSKQLAILESNSQYSMVFTNRLVLNPTGELKEDKFYTKDFYTTKDVIEGFIPGSQTLMFRNFNNLVPSFEYFSNIYSGDRYLALFCSLSGSIYKLHDITAVYRITGSGVWNSNGALKKLQQNYSLLREFHISLGIPVNNEILVDRAYKNSFSTFTYCFKRPRLLFNKKNWNVMFHPFVEFYKMNFVLFIFKAFVNRIKEK